MEHTNQTTYGKKHQQVSAKTVSACSLPSVKKANRSEVQASVGKAMTKYDSMFTRLSK